VATPAPSPGPAEFQAHGAIYGAAAKDGDVIIQAKTRAALIVRGPSGAIYFARQLAVGDAYRVPRGTHATADVSDPAAFDLYVNGKFQSLLTEPLTPLDVAPPVAVAAPSSAPAALSVSTTKPAAQAPAPNAETPKLPAA
jgi:hypothetical protein